MEINFKHTWSFLDNYLSGKKRRILPCPISILHLCQTGQIIWAGKSIAGPFATFNRGSSRIWESTDFTAKRFTESEVQCFSFMKRIYIYVCETLCERRRDTISSCLRTISWLQVILIWSSQSPCYWNLTRLRHTAISAESGKKPGIRYWGCNPCSAKYVVIYLNVTVLMKKNERFLFCCLLTVVYLFYLVLVNWLFLRTRAMLLATY